MSLGKGMYFGRKRFLSKHKEHRTEFGKGTAHSNIMKKFGNSFKYAFTVSNPG